MRLRTRQKEQEAQVRFARIQLDLAVDKMTGILDKIQDQVVVVKEELEGLRTHENGGGSK